MHKYTIPEEELVRYKRHGVAVIPLTQVREEGGIDIPLGSLGGVKRPEPVEYLVWVTAKDNSSTPRKVVIASSGKNIPPKAIKVQDGVSALEVTLEGYPDQQYVIRQKSE